MPHNTLMRHTFRKSERLCSRKAVEALFAAGSRGFTVWPIRTVWRESEETQILIVVPKRRLHHAVDRNRAKRQLREAYRLQKDIIANIATPRHIALLWIADTLVPTARVMQSVARILHHIAES